MAYWAMQTSFATVFGLYLAPYLFTNFWLVLYTWLQHTDVDVPHFEGNDWNLVKGAFMTIDRPYGPVFDFLHHRIGSTHVAHRHGDLARRQQVHRRRQEGRRVGVHGQAAR